MTDRLIVSGLSGGLVSVSYRRSGEDAAQAIGEPFAFVSPLTGDELGDLSWYLEAYLLAPYALYAEKGAAIEGRLQAWGEALFAAVFGPGLGARDAYQRAREAEAELVIRSDDPAFLALPWELMKDPVRPSPLALDLRGISRSCPVQGRLIDVPKGQALRVLMVISRPRGLDDIDFQMVARPLHERLQAVSGEVRLEVARPPTLAALDDLLRAAQEAGAPYHVLHFDGHGVHAGGGGAAGMFDAAGGGGTGYLMFESAEGDQGHPVPAGDFARVVKQGGVPLVVLNACQSGAMGGADATTSAAVATRVLQEGVRSVVAMSHSVYAVAAAEFMAAFYEALFRGRSVLEATTTGRQQLRRNPERPSPKGDTALQDWMVPVLYARADMAFPALAQTSAAAPAGPDFAAALDRMRTGATEAAADRTSAVEGIAPEAGIFVGRGAEFYTLELAARSQRVAVIQGPAGTGKTELAKGFARWWRDTGGTDDPGLVFFHSFEPGLATFGLDGVLAAISQAIVPSAVLARLQPGELRPLLVEALRAHAMLLVWDNFESVHSFADPEGATPPLDAAAQAEIRGFLAELAAPGGRSAVLITSRSDEAWLGPVRRLKLGPLPLQAAAEYATKLLVPYARGRARPAQDRAGYAALMAWLDGHPLSMKLILPHLEDRPARDLLAGLQGQGPLPPGFDGEGRTEGLGASMRYSLDHIAPETRALLPVLSLFEGVADADVLRIMSDQPDCPALYAGVSREVWGAALDRAARLGLLTALGGGVYRLHPALPAYLAAEWRATAGESYAAQRESTRDALVAAHADFGQWLHGQMTGASAPRAFGLVDLQRRTLSRMIEAALAAGRHEPAQDMLQPLFAYLKARGLTAELRSWIDRALDATEQADGTAPEFDSAAGALWLFVKSNDANLALAAHDLDAAAAIYRDIRNALQAALQTPARDRRLATTHHQLGRVAQDRGDLDAAEEQYRKALAICEALSERPGMAGTYHQLGIVAQLRGDLAAAEHWLRKSLAIKEALGNQPGMASSYGQLGLVALYRGDLDTAEDQHREALEIFNALGDRPSMASTYHHLGMVAQERGDLDAAENQYRKALAIFDALGNQPGMASTFHHLGIVAQERGHFGVAENWIRKSLAIKDALGDQLGMASSYHQLGIVVQLGGDLFAAEDWLRKALAIFDALGDRPNMAGTYHQLGIVVQLRGDLDAAEDWLRKSLAIKEALGDRPGMALSYGQVSLLAEARGDTEAALVSMIRCVTLFDTFGHPATGPAPRHLARLACALGPDALATAWQEVTGDPPPEGLWQALEQIDKDTDDDTP